MLDAEGRHIPTMRASVRRHATGRWESRTVLDFPGPTRPARPPAGRKHDIDALLAEVAELNARIAGQGPSPAEIRQLPRGPTAGAQE